MTSPYANPTIRHPGSSWYCPLPPGTVTTIHPGDLVEILETRAVRAEHVGHAYRVLRSQHCGTGWHEIDCVRDGPQKLWCRVRIVERGPGGAITLTETEQRILDEAVSARGAEEPGR